MSCLILNEMSMIMMMVKMTLKKKKMVMLSMKKKKEVDKNSISPNIGRRKKLS